jgi:hypothetical protein
MKIAKVLGLAAAAFTAFSMPANATVFSGYTDGCFSTTSCTPTNPVPPPNQSVTFDGLTFTGSTFTNKPLGTITLGTFTLSNAAYTYTGENFDLLVTFTAPAGSVNYTFDLTGTIQRHSDDGSVTISLTSPAIDYFDNGLFKLTVNDPSGMILGFLGLGFLGYRRGGASFRMA